ncbi:uncharacterized protein LOC135150572 [Daucus carota subsp. sativus]|uniref:uncharacterized protein LOC135150572 n=1 Tax=Daucus carota subsp. sativus TaxID=79200 RepID=UPI003082AC6A
MAADDSFASALRNLGGVHVLPKPQPKQKSAKKGESGSSRQGTEGTGHSSATPDPELQIGGPELDVDAVEVESPVHEPKKKRKNTSSSQKQVIDMTEEDPGKSAMELVDLGAGGEGGSRPAPKFGKYPVKKVIGLMFELPSDQDWEMMEDEGLAANFKEIGNLWGQLGGRLAGFNTHALADLKKERDLSVKSLARVSKLEKDLDLERSAREALESGMATKIKEAELRKETELGQRVKDAEARADEAEKRVAGLEGELSKLKEQLEFRKDAAVVIAEFKKSPEYDAALNKAAAAEVLRCWNVAERHIKTGPAANLQSFIELFLAAKDKIKAGKGEPEPYEGPSPSFLPPVNPDQETASDSSAESDPQANDRPAN